MHLLDLIEREVPPVPWAEGEKIPWHEAAFSERMLYEHLSQAHDAASRRADIIEQQVAWLHQEILAGAGTRILDLGCGPGLYTHQFAQLGHYCVGIDYAPAAIAYARQIAAARGLTCDYVQGDVRTVSFDGGYGLVMMIHGELTVFRPEETKTILRKSWQALQKGGQLVVEVHPLAVVRAIGERGFRWYSSLGGLFSDRPHICLREAHWQAAQKVSTERFYIIDGESGEVTRYAASIQGYSHDEYVDLFRECGFMGVVMYASLMGNGVDDDNYVVFVARK